MDRDWEQRKFLEIVYRISNQSDDSRLPKLEYEDIVSEEGRLKKDISTKFDNRKGIVFEPNFILFGKLRPYLKKWLYPNFKGIAIGDFWVFKARDSYPLFVYYLIQSYKFQVVSNLSTGTKMPRSDWKTVGGTKFRIPSSHQEQTHIGNFFKQLDNTIALHQQKLDKLKQLKKGYMQIMFPQKGEDVPGLRFADFNDRWEQRKVKEFSEETFGGGTPKTSIKEYWDGKIPWIQSSDLHEHQVSGVLAKKKITEKGLKNSATKLIPKNSIAIVTRVGVGKVALMQFKYATSQDFLSLGNLKVNEWFGIYTLYNQLQKELHNVQGTSIKGITKNELLDKKVNTPANIEEQLKIGHLFKQLDNTIDFNQSKVVKLQTLKKAFLQKMFI